MTDKTKTSNTSISTQTLKTLNYEQILNITKEIENQMLFGLYKSYKTSKSELSKIERIITKGCENIEHAQQSNSNQPEASVAFSAHFLKDLASTLISMTAVIHQYDIVVNKHLLEYCAQSIKKHF